MDKDTLNNEIKSSGEIKIADDVVGVIAGLAATEVEGIAGMSGGFTGDIAEILGRKNLSKGVKVSLDNSTTKVDLHVIVDYGSKIPEVSWKVQESVKNAIETMTGLEVLEVNIHVQGVKIKKEEPKEIEDLED
ncbi:Asp23/Gls24 family envelope stress response protein [Clostridiaceae bacterium M8S5]|nr:Asp23/Gls24 family envelope stress response protein [Clostridiaceae bacterium M8S5]